MRFTLILVLLLIQGCSNAVGSIEQTDIKHLVSDEKKLDINKIPVRCRPYIDKFLLTNNPIREAALTEQESGCNQFAESPYAKGLRQFTDDTGEWLSVTLCKHLGPYDPFNADWSLECGFIYITYLQKNNSFGSYCLNRIIAEQEYNGGAWVIWEYTYAGSLSAARKICGVKLIPDHRGRLRKRNVKWACPENYEYPEHITRRGNKYLNLGGNLCNQVIN